MRRSFRTHEWYPTHTQGFTLGWYATPRWGDFRLISTTANTMNGLILYTAEDGRSQIKLRARDQTVWLSQREMAQLFEVSTDNVGLHLKNIFEDVELSREATTEDSSVVQTEGEREVLRPVTFYNLSARADCLPVNFRDATPSSRLRYRGASSLPLLYSPELSG